MKGNRPTRIALIALGLAVLIALSGCGDETVPSDGSADAKLLALVFAAIEASEDFDQDVVDYADFALARQQLDRPDDENIYEGPFTAMLGSLGYASNPSPTSLVDAIDGKSIQAAANRGVAQGEPALVAVRTTQPFSEISDALQRDGYRLSDDLLVSSQPAVKVGFPVVADAGDGVVVLGGSADFVRKVLADTEPSLTPAAELIDEVPGAARIAQAERSECVLATAAGQDLSPSEGEYLWQVDGTANAKKLKIPEAATRTFAGAVEFGEPVAEDDLVRVEFTTTQTANLMILMLPIDAGAYDC